MSKNDPFDDYYLYSKGPSWIGDPDENGYRLYVFNCEDSYQDDNRAIREFAASGGRKSRSKNKQRFIKSFRKHYTPGCNELELARLIAKNLKIKCTPQTLYNYRKAALK